MDALALVVSVFSLGVAGVGTVLSNKRANEAIAESRKAAASALWSAAQEAVQRMIGFDPTAEPIGDRLANLRIAMIALVDELDDWAKLDGWLEAERALGAVLGREVIARAQPGDSIEKRLANLDPMMRWAQLLASNLRHFRSAGYDENAAVELRTAAEQHAEQVYTANGWEQPPKTIPGAGPTGGSA